MITAYYLIPGTQSTAVGSYALWYVSVASLSTALIGLAFANNRRATEPYRMVPGAEQRSEEIELLSRSFARLLCWAWPSCVVSYLLRLMLTGSARQFRGVDPTILDVVGGSESGRILGILLLLGVVGFLATKQLWITAVRLEGQGLADSAEYSPFSDPFVVAGGLIALLLAIDVATSQFGFPILIGALTIPIIAWIPSERFRRYEAIVALEASGHQPITAGGVDVLDTGQSRWPSATNKSGSTSRFVLGGIVLVGVLGAFGFGQPRSPQPQNSRPQNSAIGMHPISESNTESGRS